MQLQSLLKDGIRNQELKGLIKFGASQYLLRQEDKEVSEFIFDKKTSGYKFIIQSALPK